MRQYMLMLCVVWCHALITTLGDQEDDVTQLQADDNTTTDIYAVIFDAGSTGSRIHVYHFQRCADLDVELVHETFEHVQPGLSNFSADPQRGADSLMDMLALAEEEVPLHLQVKTPIVLKATAGLRLLPDGLADDILDKVDSLFKKTKFLQLDDNVDILDGADEGIFSWVTVNYLEGAFSDDRETVAALDLGGASTQITFIPRLKETIIRAPKEHLKHTSLFNKSYLIYTHSYLRLGLMSARLTIMGGHEENGAGALSSKDALSSSCLPPDIEFSWIHHGGVEFKLKGLTKSESGYKQCYASVKPLVKSPVIDVPEISKQKIYAFSYFFDMAVEADLIDDNIGGVVTVLDFLGAANRVCNSPREATPFLCMDLTYIYSLLRDGYGLNLSTEVHLVEKIDKIEVSWTLGAAFQILSSIGLLS